jgi:hypothetical protein
LEGDALIASAPVAPPRRGWVLGLVAAVAVAGAAVGAILLLTSNNGDGTDAETTSVAETAEDTHTISNNVAVKNPTVTLDQSTPWFIADGCGTWSEVG